ncbi:MAG: hypothetical protein U0K83_06505 [Bacteroidales bacterium]|nr:hypothetical protein [Bacteroidales bacterium]
MNVATPATRKINTNIKIVSPFAINDSVEEVKVLEKKHVELVEEKKVEDFKAFCDALKQLSEECETENPNLSFSIKTAECIKLNDDFIVLEVNNSISEFELENNKQKIKSFVKEKTGMDNYFLKVRCKQKEKAVKIYTPEDTYAYFKKKTNAIDTLIKSFECDLQY